MCNKSMSSRHPEVKWAERSDKVYLTVLLPDAKNVKVNLEPDGIFTFSATAGVENSLYELKLDLHDKVNVEESKINTGVRSIFCVLEKAEQKWWNKLLSGDGKAPHYVKVDWDKWMDEDDDGHDKVNLGGMDFSNFAGMDGMGDGMDDEFDDSDEEGQEAEKTGEIEHAQAEENSTEAKPETAPSG
ncbi:putative CS domain, HSP20-like chaperone [Dioscorea sansibarensis]